MRRTLYCYERLDRLSQEVLPSQRRYNDYIDRLEPRQRSGFAAMITRFRRRRAAASADLVGLDMLRVRVELAAASPAVVAVTSATDRDGRAIAARKLADSFSLAGYSTLFIDTALATRVLPPLAPALALEAGRDRELSSPGVNGRLAVLTLDDVTVKQTTSLPGMKAAIGILRSKFDYVVISSDLGMSSAFGVAIAATADVVLVTYRNGRRKTADDTRLAAALKPMGERFSGMVQVSPAVIDTDATAAVSDTRARVDHRRLLARLAAFARLPSTRLALSAPRGDSQCEQS